MTDLPRDESKAWNRLFLWVGFLASYFLFALLPLGLGWLLLDSYFAEEEAVQDGKIVRESRRFLEKIAGFSEVGYQLQRRFHWLRDRFVNRDIAPGQWPETLKKLGRRWGMKIEAYPFLPGGKLYPRAYDDPGNGDDVKLIWRFLYLSEPFPTPLQHARACSIFGEGIENLRSSRGQVIQFKGVKAAGSFFWDIDPFSTLGGIIFIAWTNLDPLDIVRARLQCASLSSDVSILAEDRNRNFFTLYDPQRAPTAELVPHLFRASDRSLVRQAGKTWVSLSIKEYTFYLGISERKTRLGYQRSWARLAIVLLGFFGFAFGYRWAILGRDTYVSIRFKLLFLFLYALMIPFMDVLVLSYKTLRESEKTLLEEVKREGVASNKAIDDGFLQMPLKLQTRFAQFYPLFKTRRAQERFHHRMNRFTWNELFTTLELRDSTGDVHVSIGDPVGTDEILLRLVKVLFSEGIRKYLPERFLTRPDSEREGVSDLFVQSMIENSDIGFSNLLDFPGTVRYIMMPKREFFFIWNYYSDPAAPAPILFGSSTSSTVRNWYVKRALQPGKIRGENATGSGSVKKFVTDWTATLWVPYSGSESPALRRFAQKVRLTEETQTARLIYEGCSYIAVGSPGRMLSGYFFLTLIPESRISEALQTLRRRILGGIGAILALTFFLGWTLVNAFLKPIRNLGMGIQAIKARNPNFRLELLQKDEFGDLSKAFNEMIENLEELNAGKLVQEKLFPKGVFSLGEYRAFGISKPATDLGGDYLDYLRIDDNQFLVLIGDVSGHGIPAALIMAMSKAIVATFPKADAHPEPLLVKMNHAIHSVMKGKRNMTMAFMWVNAASHEISFHHFGHPFPIRWRKTGPAEFMKNQGPPLGSFSRLRNKPVTLRLEPGERFVLYTDGLVESFSTDTGEDGFLLFRSYVENQPWRSIEKSCEAILDRHPFFLRHEPQPDDFTVVILERKPAMDGKGENS